MNKKDEILADFQACIGNDDYGSAFSMLEESGWDLVVALNKAIPNQASRTPDSEVFQEVTANPATFADSFSTAFSSQSERDVFDLDIPPATKVESMSSLTFTNEPSSTMLWQKRSSPSPPVLDINIQVLCGGASEGSSFPLELPGSATLRVLQEMLHQLVGIPPSNQMLEGFEKPVTPDTILTVSVLPKNMTLTLDANSSFNNSFGRLNGTCEDEYILLIHDEKNGTDYKLPFPATKLIKELKSDVFHLTGISVRNQVWKGWPGNVEDYMPLSSSGISKEHHLTVAQHITPELTPRLSKKVTVKSYSEENSSGDEFEDASSEIMPEDEFLLCDVPTSQRPQPLIPDNVDSELVGVQCFIEGFTNRFGSSCVPFFFPGTLEEALRASVMLQAKQRKLLAVYLHHDGSVLCNVFCSQALCHYTMVDYFTNNFVIWGWDITHESNRERLMQLVILHFGPIAGSTVKGFSLDKLPALLIITRSRGAIEVVSVISGSTTLDEVMTTLLHSYEMFEEQRQSEAMEEEVREQRETMMAEQDAAYHASLEADRAKTVAKKRAEMEERMERERQQSIKEKGEALREAVRASLEKGIPPEPPQDCQEPITVFRFRAPKGQSFGRSFLKRTPLKIVLNYLCVKGFPADEYKYLQLWPRRCIASLDSSKTLEALNMPNQETLTIEERPDSEN